MKLKPGLHPRNKHKNGYDFDVLTQHNKNLISFVTKNDYGNLTIDFSDPKAVKELNLTLLKFYYGINKWVFPDENLCPPIPGRVDYIHYVSDLLSESKNIDKITKYVKTNPMAGYHIHIYSNPDGGNEVESK